MEKTSSAERYFYFLNRNYYVAVLLHERLEEMNSHVFSDELSYLIGQVIDSLRSESTRLRNILLLVNKRDEIAPASTSIALLESIFDQVIPAGGTVQQIYLYDYLYIANAMLGETEDFDLNFSETDLSGYDRTPLVAAMNFLVQKQAVTT